MEKSPVPPAEALRFFGRTVAGTTHELVNVLNIVGELAGLQDDLLRGVAAGRPIDLEKLATLAERTRTQTERGHALPRHLNRFAHSVDHDCTRYDLSDLFESFAALAERRVRLARAHLTVRPPLASVVLEGSPFAVHLALSLCLEAVVQGSPPQPRGAPGGPPHGRRCHRGGGGERSVERGVGPGPRGAPAPGSGRLPRQDRERFRG